MQEKDQKYWTLKQAADRSEKILKKHMDENRELKRQVQTGGSSAKSGAASSSNPKAAASGEALPQKRDFKTMRAQRKEQATKSIEEFNQKFLTDLQGQIDDMFTNVAKTWEGSLSAVSKPILQVDIRFAALFNIYNICALLSRSKIKIYQYRLISAIN